MQQQVNKVATLLPTTTTATATTTVTTLTIPSTTKTTTTTTATSSSPVGKQAPHQRQNSRSVFETLSNNNTMNQNDHYSKLKPPKVSWSARIESLFWGKIHTISTTTNNNNNIISNSIINNNSGKRYSLLNGGTASAAGAISHVASAGTTSPAPARNKWMALLFGQGLALLVASVNASSFELSFRFNMQTEFFQMFLVYAILTLHLWKPKKDASTSLSSLSSLSSSASHDMNNNHHSASVDGFVSTVPFTRIRLRIRWWYYFIYAVMEVLPSVMTLLSFRYTSLTSTTLLGSLMAPSTMFFSGHLLGKVFRSHHYLGAAMCVLGGCLTVWSDVDLGADVAVDAAADSVITTTTTTTTTITIEQALLGDLANKAVETLEETAVARPLSYVGDLLAIGAALMYGLGDSLAEYSIKHVDKDEYLGMLGLFGTIMCGLVFPWLEGKEVEELFRGQVVNEQGMEQEGGITGNRWHIAAVVLWYILSVLGYYVGLGAFLQQSDATLLNLSLQAANLWVILFSWAVYKELPPLAFFFALVLVAAGIYEYEIRGRKIEEAEALAVSLTASSAVEFHELMSHKEDIYGEQEQETLVDDDDDDSF